MRTAPPLVAPLFRSDGQARLLAEVFLFEDSELNLRELAERTGLAYASVHREVGRLLDAGLLRERRRGNARMVQPNPDSPLTRPVRELIMISAGPVPLLAAELRDIEGVEAAFLYGSFAARVHGDSGAAPNDIDVMVVGAPEPMAVYQACQRVGDQVGRPVNPTIMMPAELDEHTGFITEVRRNPTVVVLGELPWR